MKRIYVGNLSYQTTESSLESAFGAFGTVRSVAIIKDRDTGRSRGFGFVEMSSDSEADEAIAGLHQSDLDGRSITVNEARPRNEGGGGGGGRGEHRGGGGRGGDRGGGGGGGSRWDRPRW